MDDELRDRRSKKKMVEGVNSLTEGLVAAPPIREFRAWFHENMPRDAMQEQALPTVTAMLGVIVAAWIDAGATREQLKECMSRFVDMTWENCQILQGPKDGA